MNQRLFHDLYRPPCKRNNEVRNEDLYFCFFVPSAKEMCAYLVSIAILHGLG